MPALHERELAKLEALSDALANGLIARSTAALQTTPAARAGIAAFADATLSWLDEPVPVLADRFDRAETALRSLLRHGADPASH